MALAPTSNRRPPAGRRLHCRQPLPIDVSREMGADVAIVVDLGGPADQARELDSYLG